MKTKNASSESFKT